MKTIVLEADDLMPSVGCFDLLYELKDHIPNFKITLFTLAYDIGYKQQTMDLKKHKEWAAIVNSLDWVEVAVHGFDHKPNEFGNLSFNQALKRIEKIERYNKLTGLKATKIFRAPFWLASKGTYQALAHKGYAVGTDRNQIRPNIKGMRQFRWNWSIESPMPDFDVVKGHGHVTQAHNDLAVAMPNLMNLPQDAEYLFVSEYLERYGSD